MKNLVFLLFTAICITACFNTNNKDILENDHFKITLNKKGDLTMFTEKKSGKDMLLKGNDIHFITIQNDGINYTPTSWKCTDKTLKFIFSELSAEVSLKIESKSNYITFEITEIKSDKLIEKVILGSYRVSPSEKIGQSIGIAYNDETAIGLMGLNLKSRGGFEIVKRERFGNASKKINGGASLSGYVRNRSYERTVDNFIQKSGQAIAVKDNDAKIEGAKFALYCIPAKSLKTVVEEIVLNEKLPYIKTKNVWNKKSGYSSSSKFIMPYDVNNIEECINVAKKAGITCIYHGWIFKTWGNFELRKNTFPKGYKSVRECSDKAMKHGINLGAHTLTNFITTNDAYITPKPHPDLALAGITKLGKNISETDNELILQDENMRPAYYDANREKVNPRWRRHMAVRIGDEIIEYSYTTTEGKLILKDCKRGAFGTKAVAHKSGEQVARLISHGYKVFFPNINLMDQMAKNLAHFFNETNLKRISFDGIEGGLTAGHGPYGCDRFVKVFFDNLKDPNILANSSDVTHFGWHYFANESWGEPWTSKNFREAHLNHRLKVQKGLKEDLLPRKMGQFSINERTTKKDIEWVMGLCAGYDAGVDFYISPNFEKINKEADAILSEIKKWEEARMKCLFSEDQKKKLRDPFTFYALDKNSEGVKLVFIESWAPEGGKAQGVDSKNTLPSSIIKSGKKVKVSLDYKHINKITEPGQPTASIWKYFCKGDKQKLQYVIRLPKASKTSVKGIYLKVGTQKAIMPFLMQPGDYIINKGDKNCLLYSNDNKLKKSINFPQGCFSIKQGKNTIEFDYKGNGKTAGPEMIINFITKVK